MRVRKELKFKNKIYVSYDGLLFEKKFMYYDIHSEKKIKNEYKEVIKDDLSDYNTLLKMLNPLKLKKV